MRVLHWDLPTDIDSKIEAVESCLLEIKTEMPLEQIYRIWLDSWEIIERDGRNDRYFICKVENSSIERGLCLCFAAFSATSLNQNLNNSIPIASQVSNNAFFIVVYPKIQSFESGTLFRLMGYGISPQGIAALSPDSPTREISPHNFASSTLDLYLGDLHDKLDESLRSKGGQIEVIKHFFPDTLPQLLELPEEGADLTPENRLIQIFERYAESRTENTKLKFSIVAANGSSLVIRCIGTLSSGSEQVFSEANISIMLRNIAHSQVAQSEGHPCVIISLKDFVQLESQQKSYSGGGLTPTFKHRSHKLLHERIECKNWEGAHQIKLALDAFLIAHNPPTITDVLRRPARHQEMD